MIYSIIKWLPNHDIEEVARTDGKREATKIAKTICKEEGLVLDHDCLFEINPDNPNLHTNCRYQICPSWRYDPILKSKKQQSNL